LQRHRPVMFPRGALDSATNARLRIANVPADAVGKCVQTSKAPLPYPTTVEVNGGAASIITTCIP
jgi:hypothetical protein